MFKPSRWVGLMLVGVTMACMGCGDDEATLEKKKLQKDGDDLLDRIRRAKTDCLKLDPGTDPMKIKDHSEIMRGVELLRVNFEMRKANEGGILTRTGVTIFGEELDILTGRMKAFQGQP